MYAWDLPFSLLSSQALVTSSLNISDLPSHLWPPFTHWSLASRLKMSQLGHSPNSASWALEQLTFSLWTSVSPSVKWEHLRVLSSSNWAGWWPRGMWPTPTIEHIGLPHELLRPLLHVHFQGLYLQRTQTVRLGDTGKDPGWGEILKAPARPNTTALPTRIPPQRQE